MVSLAAPQALDATFTDAHFGGNILASRDELSDDTGFADLVDDLGVTSLRYPGGSLTENYFDITNPDAELVVKEDGEECSFIALSDFMSFAEAEGLSAVIVLPTRNFFSDETDENGDRYVDLDEAALRGFVNDVVSGVYGDATIDAFEIGNEYWGSGEMSSVEYGRLAAEMTRIIDDELQGMADTHPEAEEIDLIVQSGYNYNYASLTNDYAEYETAEEVVDALNEDYGTDFDDGIIGSSGSVNWTLVANELILDAFETEESKEAVDGVVTHLYSKGSVNPSNRTFQLDMVEQTWGEEFDEIDVYVTEWNQAGNSGHYDREEDYGLFQSHEMLNTLEEMVFMGVDQAQVWPLLQNTANTLCEGFTYDELTTPGEMFSMMADSLPGKTLLDFDDSSRETEAVGENADVHGYYGEDEVVFFIASISDRTSIEEIDMSEMFTDISSATINILGVAEGQSPGDNSSDAVVTEIPLAEAVQDGILVAELKPGEIMHVVIDGFEPTEDFAAVMREVDADPQNVVPPAMEAEEEVEVITPAQAQAEPQITASDVDALISASAPSTQASDDEDDEEDDGDDSGGGGGGGDGGGMGDMSFVLLLPLLALFGLG
ncbi:hypothetical protein FIU97_13130 [Roseivivax sp. THAF40]|uniref:type I secretion protein n=1 Tax=unclassified Roseivivax TaxID=2639302 RepID=UPI001267DB51|nr:MULTISPECIES: type I secretion protein [unclassified Roseivivax]QFS83716.1 hypothetical protein FIV09_12840 [Roseivivax sp. THAF197b]QFT47518.1 hypothetical protein FIU97_13130 [Roseivivax sp. THAF40]